MKLLSTTLVFALAFALNTMRAAEKKAPETKPAAPEQEMAELVKLGPGIHHIKKDKKGRVQSLIAVGEARISTVLGGAKGTDMARKKAAQGARAEFVKWLGEKVEVHESAENEATIFMAGSEENDKETLSESGKAVEKTSDSYKSAAEGLVRGLVLLHSEVNATDKTCVAVYGWSVANAKAAKHTATHDPNIEDEPAKPKVGGADGTGGKDSPDKKTIKGKKATSKDAADFLK